MLSLVSYYTCKSFKQKSSKGKKVDKKMANNLDHKSIRFLKKIIVRFKRKIIFPLMYSVIKIT